ncbi:MAG TPA: DUF397 domain-containing protein [Actinophytocola sp.]|jgi:hypothetical protein|uniref:DUF397 domain-containing protein n=1 Tax=Actinophytocola sp. TaxID=1872138 RepID=UPI002E0092B0|nr:DUF397 domain-containing protein [Actinophytocola sp.]
MTRWRKSTYSGLESDCIELASTLDAIRDSKNPGDCLRVARLGTFIQAIKSGAVDQS